MYPSIHPSIYLSIHLFRKIAKHTRVPSFSINNRRRIDQSHLLLLPPSFFWRRALEPKWLRTTGLRGKIERRKTSKRGWISKAWGMLAPATCTRLAQRPQSGGPPLRGWSESTLPRICKIRRSKCSVWFVVSGILNFLISIWKIHF